mmetsp:Transcript_28833/g.43310  ORF Transcript_28833/g.43310 Transcript_28833/m.43310 type:complete len:434 (-) Transcript_28833:584-1885(-)
MNTTRKPALLSTKAVVGAIIVALCKTTTLAMETPTNTTTPVCDNDEELFQLRLITGENSWSGAPVSHRVITESTGDLHDECIGCRHDIPGADIQLCLPKNQCHTVLVGRLIGRWNSCFNGGVEELQVIWAGETIRSNNAYLFERVDFGEGCQIDSCDPDNELEFEFFLDRRQDSSYPNPFAWNLAEVATDESFLQGQAPYNESSFIYEKACVPRSSCLEFYMGYPSNTTSGFYDPSPYSIRLDGVIYDEHELRFGTDLFSGPDKLDQTVNLGDCSVETLCNATTEDLFRMEFTTEALVECFASANNDYNYSSSISSSDMRFWLQDIDEEDFASSYVWSADYEDFEVDRKYAFMSCIPNDRCAQFFFATDNQVASYSLYQNGVELTQRSIQTDSFEGLTLTNAGVCAPAPTLSLTLERVLVASVTVLSLLNMFW